VTGSHTSSVLWHSLLVLTKTGIPRRSTCYPILRMVPTRPSQSNGTPPTATLRRVYFSWSELFGCELGAQDAVGLEQALGVVIELFGLQPFRGGVHIPSQHFGNPLGNALRRHDETLWCRWVQTCRDLADHGRVSYHGPMHDLRDILVSVLRNLATNEEVIAQEWYKEDPSAHGPTHAQRARYILSVLHKRGSSAVTGADQTITAVSNLARTTYQRASAAHSKAHREEAFQVLRYVEALLCDLLGVEGR
jgi:hypothetical protein